MFLGALSVRSNLNTRNFYLTGPPNLSCRNTDSTPLRDISFGVGRHGKRAALASAR
jgi:hypothetical protein